MWFSMVKTATPCKQNYVTSFIYADMRYTDRARILPLICCTTLAYIRASKAVILRAAAYSHLAPKTCLVVRMYVCQFGWLDFGLN